MSVTVLSEKQECSSSCDLSSYLYKRGSHRHSLVGQLTAGQLADAGDDIVQGPVICTSNGLSPVVAGHSGRPGLHQSPQVDQQKIGCGSEIGGPPVGAVTCTNDGAVV